MDYGLLSNKKTSPAKYGLAASVALNALLLSGVGYYSMTSNNVGAAMAATRSPMVGNAVRGVQQVANKRVSAEMGQKILSQSPKAQMLVNTGA
eukprot:CAMPEP_0167770098 /NCGR_PEP_ID=MMETSP0110_2-20121227/17714_1 /TAXON_ID=629695 /ORGANISM="Gymnochlora sp., Strain CCMP2014" /LENGTH=92 /DNA_ID=CAMNT_0007659205 /DNA_START=14 /DNA_END=289 /DNA_ORIENTATION=-